MRRRERGAALLLVLLAIAALWAMAQIIWLRVQLAQSARPAAARRAQALWLARSAVSKGPLARQIHAHGVTYTLAASGSRARTSSAVVRTPDGAAARVEVRWSAAVPLEWTEHYERPTP